MFNLVPWETSQYCHDIMKIELSVKHWKSELNWENWGFNFGGLHGHCSGEATCLYTFLKLNMTSQGTQLGHKKPSSVTNYHEIIDTKPKWKNEKRPHPHHCGWLLLRARYTMYFLGKFWSLKLILPLDCMCQRQTIAFKNKLTFTVMFHVSTFQQRCRGKHPLTLYKADEMTLTQVFCFSTATINCKEHILPKLQECLN